MFLFIAHKSESSDYCKGCLMESYSGNFVCENFLSKAQLVERWGVYLFENKNLGINETGYNFYIFKNGIKVFNQTTTYWDGYQKYEYESEEYFINLAETNTQEQEDLAEIASIYKEAEKLADEMQTTKIENENKKKAEEEKIAKDKATHERFLQFHRLKKEFGE